VIRETGKIPPAAQFETHVATGEIYEAATLPTRLAILTRDVMRGLELANQIPSGIVHINEQTVDHEPNIPFGGVLASGTGARFGGSANLDAFTDTRWVTVRGDIAPYPF
jgi:benzaldehyde dehydrogenase (NAD)